MERKKALLANRLLTRVEELEMQLSAIENLPTYSAEDKADMSMPYPILFGVISESWSEEDIEDLKAVVQIKLDKALTKLEEL